MSTQNVAVFGIFTTPTTAERAVDHLLTLGFPHAAISVLLPDDETTLAFAYGEHTRYEGRVKSGGILLSVHCETPEQIDAAGDALSATGAEDISTAEATPIQI